MERRVLRLAPVDRADLIVPLAIEDRSSLSICDFKGAGMLRIAMRALVPVERLTRELERSRLRHRPSGRGEREDREGMSVEHALPGMSADRPTLQIDVPVVASAPGMEALGSHLLTESTRGRTADESRRMAPRPRHSGETRLRASGAAARSPSHPPALLSRSRLDSRG